MDNNINNNNNNFFTMNTIDKFEFTFNFKDEDSIYISHHTNQLDEEMIDFINQEEILDLSKVTSIKVEMLKSYARELETDEAYDTTHYGR